MARLVVHFVLHGERSLHFRALQRHTGLPHRSLQTELSRLQALGVVIRKEVGRRVMFAADPAAPLCQALHEVVRHVADPAELLRDALADTPGIETAFLYGSAARDDARPRPDSDVDLLVLGLLDDAPQLAARTMEVSALLDREVNLALYAPKQFQRSMRTGSAFVRRVLSEPKRWVVGDQRLLSRIVG